MRFLIFSIIGAFIGAGFASGQEIYLFFYKYGINGILGLFICSCIICSIIYKVLILIKEKDIKSYEKFLDYLINNKHSKSYRDENSKIIKEKHISEIIKYTTKFMNIIVNSFLLITFFIMISAFGTYFYQEFHINNIISSALLSIICFFVFMANTKGLTKVNNFVIPILIYLICRIGFSNLCNLNISETFQMLIDSSTKNTENLSKLSWLFQSIIYCSYNMILVIPVLINLNKYIKEKRQIKIVSIIVGTVIFILGLCIFFLLVNLNNEQGTVEMPTVYVISKKFPKFKTLYGIVVLFSILTTAISSGISFLNNTSFKEPNFKFVAFIMCAISIIVSNVGFSALLNFLFPFFGYLGLMQILLLYIRT